MTNAFRRTAERRNKMVRWPISPTETSAQLTPFRLIAPLGEKLIVYLAKKLTFATPGPRSRKKLSKRVWKHCAGHTHENGVRVGAAPLISNAKASEVPYNRFSAVYQRFSLSRPFPRCQAIWRPFRALLLCASLPQNPWFCLPTAALPPVAGQSRSFRKALLKACKKSRVPEPCGSTVQDHPGRLSQEHNGRDARALRSSQRPSRPG
jgi:hypothetical protein